ncbi:MAG TPA: hypothetical protein VNZ66_10095 [Aeromicrobium sp.]|nr:hypothetical protein [Aeromicrobium sp.]
MTVPTHPVPRRRVRHDVADGAAVMVCSLLLSIGAAAVLAAALAVIGRLW